jgi:hypothetical protein
MPLDSYASQKVLKALADTSGDRKAAHKLVVQWASADPRLLMALAKPFLSGIVGHAVQQAPQEARARAGRKPMSKPRALTAEALDSVIGQLGASIGEAKAPQGMAAVLSRPKPTKAGQGHQDSMRQLARAFAAKRLDTAGG